MASSSVVLSTPGPRVRMVAFDVSANRAASAWRGANDRPLCSSTQGQRPVHVDVRPGVLPRHQLDEPAGDFPLGPVHASEQRARRVRHGVGDDGAFGQFQLETGSDRIAGHVEQLGRQRPEFVGRQSAMAVVRRLGQRVADTGRAPGVIAGLADTQFHRDHVGHFRRG